MNKLFGSGPAEIRASEGGTALADGHQGPAARRDLITIGPNSESPSIPASTVEAADLFLFKEMQDCLRARLPKGLLTLFRELSGLELKVVWPDAFQLANRCRGTNGEPKPPNPAGGSVRDWSPVLGLRCPSFRELLEQDFHSPVQIHFYHGGLCPLTLVLSRGARARIPRGKRGPSRRAAGSTGSVDAVAALLGVLVDYLDATLDNQLMQRRLADAQHRLKNLAVEQARLQKELRERFPDRIKPAVQAPGGSHAQHLVARMTEWTGQNYQRPMSLSELASAFGMSAAYLSHLFSKTTGVTFHKYLDELRLAKAKELLADPLNRISEIASAVGYASDDYFRQAFRVRMGISPRRWREGGLQEAPA